MDEINQFVPHTNMLIEVRNTENVYMRELFG